MKKLIVLCFAAFVAIAANAASFYWTANNIQKIDGNSSVGAMAYLIDASVVSRDAMITALTANDTSKVAGSAILTETTTVAQGTTGLSRISVTQGTASASVEKYDVYMVVLDAAPSSAKNFIVSQQLSNVSNPGFDNGSGPGLGNVNLSFGTQATAAWTAMAPEPTSGILMLVGLGALALRRRRA